MFLPHDLTSAEQGLVDSMTRQMLDHRRPTGADQEQVVRHEAAQIAAEMIFEARAARQTQGTNRDQDEPAEAIPDTGYHRRLLRMAEMDRLIRQRQMAEREQVERENAEDA